MSNRKGVLVASHSMLSSGVTWPKSASMMASFAMPPNPASDPNSKRVMPTYRLEPSLPSSLDHVVSEEEVRRHNTEARRMNRHASGDPTYVMISSLHEYSPYDGPL